MHFQRTTLLSFLLAALAVGAVALVGCDSAGLENDENAGGTVNVRLTDAPLDDVVEAHVTIERVELIGEDGAITLTDTAQEFDLLTLQNGITADLAARDDIPAGEYEQLRLIVGEEAYLIFEDKSRTDLKIPSGQQTGIKINLPDFEINGDADEVDIVVDFDAAKSFVKAGASGKYLFKPVLHAESLERNGEAMGTDAEIEGRLTAVGESSEEE